MLEIQPFRTSDTPTAAYVVGKSKQIPALVSPSPFTRKIFFVFEDGRAAEQLATEYLRDKDDIRSIFAAYQNLKGRVLAKKPFVAREIL